MTDTSSDDTRGSEDTELCPPWLLGFLSIATFNAVTSLLCGFLIYSMISDKSRKQSAHPGLIFVCSLSIFAMLSHSFVPLAWQLQSELMYTASITMTGISAIIGVWSLDLSELSRLREVFTGTPYWIPESTLRTHIARLSVGTLMMGAWMAVNETLDKGQSLTMRLILGGLTLSTGMCFLGGFVSLSWMTGQRLIRLLVHSRALQNQHPSHHSGKSMESTTNGTTMKDSDPDVLHRAQHSLSPGLPSLKDKPSYSVSQWREQDPAEFSREDRDFLEALGKTAVLSALLTSGCILIGLAFLLWSIDSCYGIAAFSAYFIESLGLSLVVLQVYWSQGSSGYRKCCAQCHLWSLKAAALASQVQLEELLSSLQSTPNDTGLGSPPLTLSVVPSNTASEFRQS